jgi:hypothetical protein
VIGGLGVLAAQWSIGNIVKPVEGVRWTMIKKERARYARQRKLALPTRIELVFQP